MVNFESLFNFLPEFAEIMAYSGSKRSASNATWWDEVERLERYSSKGGATRWKCKQCNKEKSGGANRVRAHLCHVNNEKAQVNKCPGTTPEMRRELLAKYPSEEEKACARKKPAIDASYFSRHGEDVHLGDGQQYGGLGSFAFSQDSQSMGASSGKQQTLGAAWDPRKKERVDAAVARFFYHDHVAFNVARSPYFIEMVQEIARYGPTYKPPSYETLRTTLLQKEKAAIECALESVHESWAKNGVSLIADGWSDTRKRSIHGMVAYSRGRMQFISSHDASGTGKTADQLVEEWAEGIEKVGPENVIQFLADGEATNRAAGLKLEDRYPHITFSPCFAHCLSNLLKDVGSLPWVDPHIQKGKEIISFIQNHQFILNEFRKRSAKKDLLKYSETRFGYNFLMMKRLSKVQLPLKQLVVCNEWMGWALSRSRAGIEVARTIQDFTFWDEVNTINAMMKPIMRLMRIADGREPCIGKVYEGADRMIEKIGEMGLSDEKYAEVRELCEARWNGYHSPMHAAAYVLDPEFQGCGQEADDEVMDGWETVLSRQVRDADKRRLVKDQLGFYRSKLGRFGSADAQRDRFKIGAALWWEDYGARTPQLQSLAVRILSQGASSSPIEQLWSVFGHVASKKRNKFGTKQVNDLIFVSANLRLLGDMASPKPEKFILLDEESSDDEETHGLADPGQDGIEDLDAADVGLDDMAFLDDIDDSLLDGITGSSHA